MEVKNIQTVVVVGGGTMGPGIAQNFAEAGLSVRILRRDKAKLDLCLSQIQSNLHLFQEFGLLKEPIPIIETRIKPELTQDMVKVVNESDFMVETVSENLELKRELFSQLDSCRDDIILSSNTSSLPVSDIARGCCSAHRMIGLHYFNPPHIVPAVEIHFGPETSPETIATTSNLMLKIGKKPLVVKKEVPGFIINRLQAALTRESCHLINEGVASPEDIDTASKAVLGLRWVCTGILESMDMTGLDIVTASNRINKDLDNNTEPSPILIEKVKKGELGFKTGRGWFNYAGRSPAQIRDEHSRRLLRQLALFRSFNP
jgi:3-hydroxybutyryl-CoA dehydrogenase